uniref:Uncharacterized protein n=1 Tax=Haptolina brevifila TaxID=156173 RepID=A0A7S2G6A3_9EUKA
MGALTNYEQISTPMNSPFAPAGTQLILMQAPRNGRTSSLKRGLKSTSTNRCAASYVLTTPDAAHPHLAAPYPYELPSTFTNRPAPRLTSTRPTGMPGVHQQPPDVLQLWLSPPADRVTPVRAGAKGPRSGSRGRVPTSALLDGPQLDPRLVGAQLVRPGSAPTIGGTKKRRGKALKRAPIALMQP